jgi:hypothetical protein
MKPGLLVIDLVSLPDCVYIAESLNPTPNLTLSRQYVLIKPIVESVRQWALSYSSKRGLDFCIRGAMMREQLSHGAAVIPNLIASILFIIGGVRFFLFRDFVGVAINGIAGIGSLVVAYANCRRMR